MVNQKIETPDQLLHLQLRTALTMEDHSLAALGVLASAAKSAEIKKMFRHHADETKEQIDNLRKVFSLLELKQTTSPSPSTTGISKQAEALIARAGSKVMDQVVLSSALGNEHYEIAAYEALLVPVTALGASDAAALLQYNLEQEIHTSEELRATLQRVVG